VKKNAPGLYGFEPFLIYSTLGDQKSLGIGITGP
jgi:hypothetical protein